METASLQALLLVVAFVLSSVIGLERDLRQRSPCCAPMPSSAWAWAPPVHDAGRYGFDAAGAADPTRIAAQVVSGIGFIGAGVISTHRDGRGILRSVLSRTTELGYLLSEVEMTRHDPSRDVVSVSIDAEGVREPSELVDALQALGGVVAVRSRHPSAD